MAGVECRLNTFYLAKRIVKIEGRLNVRKMRREEKQDTKIDIMFS